MPFDTPEHSALAPLTALPIGFVCAQHGHLVDNHLRTNRKLLKQYTKAGKATVRAKVLLDQGFNPRFFTHYWKNQKGDVYLFAYEYGFLKRKENAREKYILILWQDYMKKEVLP